MGKSDEEEEEEDEQEGESDDAADGSTVQNCHLDEPDDEEEEERRADTDEHVESSALERSAGARLEKHQEDRELALVKKVEKSDSDHSESKESTASQKPKIWSLAETATSETVKKPLDNIYHPAGKLWAEWASRNALFVPTCYTTHEIL